MLTDKKLDFVSADFEAADFELAEFMPADQPGDDPLTALPYTGDPEIDSATELTAIKSAFQVRAEQEDLRRNKATDSEYWLCLCFQTREQASAFARGIGGAITDKYMDGCQVARRLGVEIPADATGFGRVRADRALADLSIGLPVRLTSG